MDTEPQQESSFSENQPSLSKKERRELRREEKRAAHESTRKSRSLRRVFIWVIAVVAIGGATAGTAYIAMRSPSNPDTGDASPLSATVSSADWIRGNPSASVTFVEYGDFQCPACASYYPLVKGLKDEFGADIAFVFRHFPLTRAHPNAEEAATAAEAAGMQGKFWEMHDLLFERQDDWAKKPRPRSTFVAYATELGLNTDQFEKDMDRADVKDKINAHYKTGLASDVNATPTFFLSGAKLENPKSYDDIRHMLSQAVAAATSTAGSSNSNKQ